MYDPESNRIILIPVPEYTIVFEKTDDGDASSEQPDNSTYREDGSLEVFKLLPREPFVLSVFSSFFQSLFYNLLRLRRRC